MCTSKCTGEILEVHSNGIFTDGEPRCMECGMTYSKKGFIRAMKYRYPDNWEFKIDELNSHKRKIRSIIRSSRRKGYSMMETIYYIDPPINLYSHIEGDCSEGQHIYGSKPSLEENEKMTNIPFNNFVVIGYSRHE